MNKNLHQFKLSKNTIIVTRVLGAGLEAKLDLRIFQAGKPTKEGITIPLELQPELEKSFARLHDYEEVWE